MNPDTADEPMNTDKRWYGSRYDLFSCKYFFDKGKEIVSRHLFNMVQELSENHVFISNWAELPHFARPVLRPVDVHIYPMTLRQASYAAFAERQEEGPTRSPSWEPSAEEEEEEEEEQDGKEGKEEKQEDEDPKTPDDRLSRVTATNRKRKRVSSTQCQHLLYDSDSNDDEEEEEDKGEDPIEPGSGPGPGRRTPKPALSRASTPTLDQVAKITSVTNDKSARKRGRAR